ncbi:MAG TPA: hypothetical protein VMW57_06050 [Methyloceanibacter sp.]|nr:hypothetical protein [Methyloceanibacter sp.]
MIEIEHEHGAAFVPAGLAYPVVELFEKSPAIGEPGQRVMPRQPLCLPFGDPPLLHLRTQIHDAARGEDDGGNANKKQESDEFVELVVFMDPAVFEEEVEGIDPYEKSIDRTASAKMTSKSRWAPGIPLS